MGWRGERGGSEREGGWGGGEGVRGREGGEERGRREESHHSPDSTEEPEEQEHRVVGREKADARPNTPLTVSDVMRQDRRPNRSERLPHTYPPTIIPRKMMASRIPSSVLPNCSA